MKKTKFFALILSLVMCAPCLLWGCSLDNNTDLITVTSGSSGENSDIVTIYGTKSDTQDLVAIEKAIGGFNATHSKINIVYEGVSGKLYNEALDRRIAMNALDDIFTVDQQHYIDMRANGRLADISSALDLSKFTESSKKQFLNDDGSVYFVPTYISVYGLYINYDLLKAHGISIPQNYGEFSDACDHFVSLGITPIVANNGASLRALAIAKGMYPVYTSGKIKATIRGFNVAPQTILPYLDDGIDLVAEMLGKGWIDAEEALKTNEASDDLALFADGTRPFMISGGQSTTRVAEKNRKLNYGVHPFPILEDGSVLVTDADSCLAVNAASKNLDKALEFLSYFMQKNVVWDYCESQNSYTVISSDKRTPSDKTVAPATEYLKNYQSVFCSDFNLTIPTNTILDNCGAMLLVGASAAEVKAHLADVLSAE